MVKPSGLGTFDPEMREPKTFRHPVDFQLNQRARILESGEIGLVVSINFSIDAAVQYLLRYKAADGRAVEHWWASSALGSL